MVFTFNQKAFLNSNSSFISRLFILREHEDFLLQYVTSKQFNKFLSAGQTNEEQIEELSTFIQYKKHDRLYEALVKQLLMIHKANGNLIEAMMKTCDGAVQFKTADKMKEIPIDERNKRVKTSKDLEILNNVKEGLMEMRLLCEESQMLCDRNNNSPAIADKLIPLTATCSNFITTLSSQFPLVDDMPDDKWNDAKRLFFIVQQMALHFPTIEAHLSAATLKDLARLYHNAAKFNFIVLCRFEEAVEYSLHELRILRKINCDDNNEHVAECLSETGFYSNWIAKEDRISIEYCEKALEIFRSISIPDNDPRIATVIDRIGWAYRNDNNISISFTFCSQALEMRKKIFAGADHKDVALSLHNIGYLYLINKNCPKSLESHLLALEMRRRLYPDGHPFIAYSLNAIATIYKEQKNFNKALQYFQETRAMYSKVYKEDHWDVAVSLADFGLIHLDMENFKYSLVCFIQSNEMFRRLYKGDHSLISQSEFYIAYSNFKMKKWNEAIEHFNVNQQMCKRLYNNGDHEEIALNLSFLASCLEEIHDYHQAINLFTEAREMYLRLFSEENANVKDIARRINQVQQKLAN